MSVARTVGLPLATHDLLTSFGVVQDQRLGCSNSTSVGGVAAIEHWMSVPARSMMLG